RQIVGHLEICRRVEANSHVVVNEGRRVIAATHGLARIYLDDPVVDRTVQALDGGIKGIRAIAAAATSLRQLEVLRTIVAGRARGEGGGICVDLHGIARGSGTHSASPVRSPVGAVTRSA